MNDIATRWANDVMRRENARLEAEARARVREMHPRIGDWLLAHPRALKLAIRVRPSAFPVIEYRQTEVGGLTARVSEEQGEAGA